MDFSCGFSVPLPFGCGTEFCLIIVFHGNGDGYEE